MSLRDLRERLAAGESLTDADITDLFEAAKRDELPLSRMLEIFALQNSRDRSPDFSAEERAHELARVARYLLGERPVTPNAIDVCGTGGSQLPRINTSTLVAFALHRRANLRVCKHGNRAATGRMGSFDLLEKLGFDIDKSPEESTKDFEDTGLGFFFAPRCFPVIGKFSLARRSLGAPTMFNLLGPLLSPLRPAFRLTGAANAGNAQLLRSAMASMGGIESAVCLCSETGLDEATPAGVNYIFALQHGQEMPPQELRATDFGIKEAEKSQVLGSQDSAENLRFAQSFLAAEVSKDDPRLHSVAMNAALAMQCADASISLSDAAQLVIDGQGRPS